MTCERARELVIDAFVQPLDAADLHELRAHLDSCEACAEKTSELQRLWANLETVAMPEPSPDAEALLMQAVTEEFGSESKNSAPTRMSPSTTAVWRAAAVLALVAVGSLLTIATQELMDRHDEAHTDGKSRYMLIMTEMDDASRDSEQAQEEFSAWINDLVDQGIMESGIGLADLPPVGTPPAGSLLDLTVSGVIVIRADDAQEARRIAFRSPVITYGGFIEIRELSGNRPEE